jgi:crossover junction endodeoxyribonuclease RusA
MSDYEFTLPFPPSINTLRACVRGRMITSKKGREYFEDVAADIGGLGLYWKQIDRPVSVSITLNPPTLRKFDVDNYAKAILDSLTKCGFWLDDDQVHRLTLIKGEKIKGGNAIVSINKLV